MDRMQRTRRSSRVLSPALACLIALAAAIPASAQTADRFAVLVPAFKPKGEAKGGFGKDVAKELNKLLDQLGSHKSVDAKVLGDGLRQYGVKEDQLGDQDCLIARQLALRIDVKLVICGHYEQTANDYKVYTRVISPGTSEQFDVDPFDAADAKVAAQKIIASFQQVMEGLKVAVFCNDYVASQNWTSAIEACRNSLKLTPTNKTAMLGLATSLWKTNDQPGAIEAFKKVIDLDPADQQALLGLAVLQSQAGRTDEAMKYFNDYLTLNPGNLQVRMQIATQAAQEGGNEAALRVIEDGMSSTTGEDLVKLQEYAGTFAMNAASQKMVGAALSDTAQALLRKGLGYLEKVYQVRGDSLSVGSARNMLLAYFRLDRNDEAVTFGGKATQLFPDETSIWATYAEALSKAGRGDDAIAAYRKVLQLDPTYKPAYQRLVLWLIDADSVKPGSLKEGVEVLKDGLAKGAIDASYADIMAKKIAAAGTKKSAFEPGSRQRAVRYGGTVRECSRHQGHARVLPWYHTLAVGCGKGKARNQGECHHHVAVVPAHRGLDAAGRTLYPE